MKHRNHQKRLLIDLLNTPLYRPLMNHPGMSLVRWILEDTGESKESAGLTGDQVRKSSYCLEKKKLLRKVKLPDDKIRIELTAKGKEKARKYSIENISIKPVQGWDGRWRLVMFDIPEKDRYIRGIFRDKLVHLGFFRVQQSVWVYPHDCEKEINSLMRILHLEDFVLIFAADIKKDDVLRAHFLKKGIKL